jgi:DNA-binding GntR family transcriptional regulator
VEHDQPFIEQLRAQIAHQRQLVARSDYPAFVVADLAMHHLFFNQARVPDLWLLIRRHGGHIDRLRRLNLPMPGKIESVIRDHEAIIDAVERRDPDGAAAALRRHLSGTLTTVDQMRSEHPDYFLNG